MIYSWKIQDGSDDGSRNSFTGDTLNKNTIDIGNWMFINTFGVFRFSLPISYGAETESAMLSLYLESTEGKQKFHTIKIDYSKEINALPLGYGLNRNYSLLNATHSDIELFENDWNTFEITPLIEAITNQYLWQKDYFVVLRINIDANNEIFKFGSADIISTSAAILTVDYNVPNLEISSNVNYKESVTIGIKDFKEDVTKLDDLIIHPEHLTFEYAREAESHGIGKEVPVRIDISERLDFKTGEKLLNKVGGIFPFKCQKKNYNCILSECNLDFQIAFVNANITLVII